MTRNFKKYVYDQILTSEVYLFGTAFSLHFTGNCMKTVEVKKLLFQEFQHV